VKNDERFSSKRIHGRHCEQSRIETDFQGFGLFDRRGSLMGFFSAW
jgi:hypothetical protein